MIVYVPYICLHVHTEHPKFNINQVCVCVCTHMCACVHVCIRMCVRERMCLRACVHMGMCVFECVRMRMCACACAHASVCVCTHMCVYARTCVCAWVSVCMCVRVCSRARESTCTYVWARVPWCVWHSEASLKCGSFRGLLVFLALYPRLAQFLSFPKFTCLYLPSCLNNWGKCLLVQFLTFRLVSLAPTVSTLSIEPALHLSLSYLNGYSSALERLPFSHSVGSIHPPLGHLAAQYAVLWAGTQAGAEGSECFSFLPLSEVAVMPEWKETVKLS